LQYWGKLAGTMAGLATGRPLLALVGLILGHQFDRGFATPFAWTNKGRSSDRLDELPESFVRALFRTMGHLAKSDGRVSEEEIRAARVLMHRLGLKPGQVRDAIDWFDSGKKAGFSLHDTLRLCKREFAGHPEQAALFVRLLLEVSLSKKSIDRRERAAIWSVCQQLGVGRVELAQLEALLRAQKGFRRSPAGSADAERVRRAYALLGVSQSSTNAEIKQAYRRLMNRNHPDKLSGGDADVTAIAAAQRRTQEIRGAYDMLKARRSIR
jgi:DnaJ like chaperone protein